MANLSIYKGNDKSYPIQFIDSNGKPIDLTGCKVYFTLKNSSTDADPGVLQITNASHTNAVEGVSTIVLTNAQTDALTATTYVYDIQLVDNSSPKKITTIQTGTFTIINRVTKANT